MTMRCAICTRRLTVAAMFFAGHPVGPVCARRAGLTSLAAKGTNKLLTLGTGARAARARDTSTQMALDLEVVHA